MFSVKAPHLNKDNTILFCKFIHNGGQFPPLRFGVPRQGGGGGAIFLAQYMRPLPARFKGNRFYSECTGISTF